MNRTAYRGLPANLIEALAAQEFDRLERLFAPELRLRALLPSGLREHASAADAADRLRAWFGAADPLELVDWDANDVAGRLHIRYRFRAFEEGRWHLVEQHLFCDLEDGRIAGLDLLCSGFRPVD